MIHHTKRSLELLQEISKEISDQTFHHHYHILYDIPLPDNAVYLEIGCYAGGSACLMLQKPNIKVVSVDLGYPIEEHVVRNNVSKLNRLNNEFYYIKADSQLQNTVDKVQQIYESVDMLFIDGDHSYEGVITDFTLWNKLVKRGGYIVFDDYNDYMYSPRVKDAVNHIVENSTEYEIIGTLKNIYGARPVEMTEGNCFVVRKK